jgi:hypothetical protein
MRFKFDRPASSLRRPQPRLHLRKEEIAEPDRRRPNRLYIEPALDEARSQQFSLSFRPVPIQQNCDRHHIPADAFGRRSPYAGRTGRRDNTGWSLKMQNDDTIRELTDLEMDAVSGGLGYRCETNTGGGWSRTGCEYRSEDLAADIATTVRWAT